MKAFNLVEYLRLKEEGKEPKIVTRDGRRVRIICPDIKATTEEDLIGALVMERNECETFRSYFTDGRYMKTREDGNDLFFADFDEKPKYRPYKDAEEAYQEVVKHNSWYIDEQGAYGHVDIITAKRFDCKTFHDVLALGWRWADDNSPCGIKED